MDVFVHPADLIRSVGAVVLAVTALAGRHAPPSGADVLVQTAGRRPSCMHSHAIMTHVGQDI